MTKLIAIIQTQVWPYVRNLPVSFLGFVLAFALWVVTFIALQPTVVIDIRPAVVTCTVVYGCRIVRPVSP